MLSRLSDGIAEVKKHFYKFRCALHKNLHRKSDSKTGGGKDGIRTIFWVISGRYCGVSCHYSDISVKEKLEKASGKTRRYICC